MNLPTWSSLFTCTNCRKRFERCVLLLSQVIKPNSDPDVRKMKWWQISHVGDKLWWQIPLVSNWFLCFKIFRATSLPKIKTFIWKCFQIDRTKLEQMMLINEKPIRHFNWTWTENLLWYQFPVYKIKFKVTFDWIWILSSWYVEQMRTVRRCMMRTWSLKGSKNT